MRLFFAVNFEDKVKDEIVQIIHQIRPYLAKGRFVDRENIHLTLEFLGEIEEEKLHKVMAVMDTLEFEKITLRLQQLRYFKTRKGRLYWLGVEENEELMHLQTQLHQRLLEKGFELESRPFLPHITIGRQIKVKHKINKYPIEKQLKAMDIKVESIDLMESKMVDGKLTYGMIASKRFS